MRETSEVWKCSVSRTGWLFHEVCVCAVIKLYIFYASHNVTLFQFYKVSGVPVQEQPNLRVMARSGSYSPFLTSSFLPPFFRLLPHLFSHFSSICHSLSLTPFYFFIALTTIILFDYLFMSPFPPLERQLREGGVLDYFVHSLTPMPTIGQL